MTQHVDKWVPEPGKLVIRRIVRPWGGEEIELNYRERPENEVHYMTIAELRHGAAKACHAGHIECLTGQEHRFVGVGDFYRRYALDEDLDQFAACWQDRHNSIEQWLASLNQYDLQLLGEEKARIEQAISRRKQQ
ncbi:MAG: hypothetical protein WC866_01550 [Patescibacteria group bacterium]|jgi:hypothetical protein